MLTNHERDAASVFSTFSTDDVFPLRTVIVSLAFCAFRTRVVLVFVGFLCLFVSFGFTAVNKPF